LPIFIRKLHSPTIKTKPDMNSTMRLILTLVLTYSSLFLYSQEKCKVLMPQIAGNYEGKCKNGLANGKGTATGIDRYEGSFSKGLPGGVGKYTWSTGETYTGEWLEGHRHGIGIYIMNANGKDSIQDGLWQNDEYKGPRPEKPKVTYSYSVDRYAFKKEQTPANRVMIDIYQNGSRNKQIYNFLISSSSGQDLSYGFLNGYDNVVFPVTIKISYTTMNKLNSAPVNVKFDFVIYEPGDWTVELHN